MGWRMLDNGNLLAPRRGKAPLCPDDYTVVPGSNGFIITPILVECEHRIIESGKKSRCCEKTSDRMICNIIKQTVFPKHCKECKGNTEWITQHK